MPFANDASRKVVFFAGPHKAAATSVEEWFYNYYTKEDSDHFALRHWKWPIVVGPKADQLDEPWKVFQQLVLAPDDVEMKEEIMVAIQETFDASDTGIILGTESFDQVGRYATADAVGAMKAVLERLGVAKEEVTVIVNYRSPRLEQWISVWKHSGVPSYQNFMCDSEDRQQLREERIQQLSTLMDPLYMSQTFVKEGWNVRLIDMEGVEAANKDIVNVIACDILGGKCLMKDSIVYGHRGDDTHFNVGERDFQELTDKQREEAEKLFRARDCAFEDYLSNHPKFEVGYQHRLWQNCEEHELGREDVFIYLAGMPQALYYGLVNQFNCSEDGLTIDALFNGGKLENLEPEDVFADSNSSNFFTIVILPLICIVAIAYQVMKRSKDSIGDGIALGNLRPPRMSDAKEKMKDAGKKMKNKLKKKDIYRDEFRDRRGMTVEEMSDVFADEQLGIEEDNQFSLFSRKKEHPDSSVNLTI